MSLQPLSLAERNRRAEVFRRGVKEEFWLLLKEELEMRVKHHKDMTLKYAREDKSRESTKEAIYADVLQELLNAPSQILNYHDNVFMKFANNVINRVLKK